MLILYVAVSIPGDDVGEVCSLGTALGGCRLVPSSVRTTKCTLQTTTNPDLHPTSSNNTRVTPLTRMMDTTVAISRVCSTLTTRISVIMSTRLRLDRRQASNDYARSRHRLEFSKGLGNSGRRIVGIRLFKTRLGVPVSKHLMALFGVSLAFEVLGVG